MQLEYAQVAALLAVIREGSFEGAARALHVTASAVSQRIKQLEAHAGGIVVVRGTPCRPTSLGEALYRHGQQVELLEKDLLRSVGPGDGDRAELASPIGVASNADSLATWMVPALARFVEQTGFSLEVVVDDQDYTAEWLRSGRVLGAVTGEKQPVQGCRVEPLGVMRYRPTASARFLRRWFAGGATADSVREAPILVFNRKGQLHERFLRQLRLGPVTHLRTHYVPSPTAFVEATLAGVGWGLNPEPLVARHLGSGRLRELWPGRWLDVPLYWQQWSLTSTSLALLASAIQSQAATSLRPTRDPGRQ
jgi:LysR family transcriptional regulator, chromosome initiation inhibitor